MLYLWTSNIHQLTMSLISIDIQSLIISFGYKALYRNMYVDLLQAKQTPNDQSNKQTARQSHVKTIINGFYRN